jgi:hypothetical protein
MYVLRTTCCAVLGTMDEHACWRSGVCMHARHVWTVCKRPTDVIWDCTHRSEIGAGAMAPQLLRKPIGASFNHNCCL